MSNDTRVPSQQSQLKREQPMKTSDSSDVIQGDEQCRDGHYRAKLNLRTKTESNTDPGPAVQLDPNNSISLQAQNPMTWASSGSGVPLKKLREFLPSGTRCSTGLAKWVRFGLPKLF
jgi:hypothetical protein